VTAEVAQSRRVALLDGGRRLDLVVPVRARVSDVLHAAGVPDGRRIRVVGVAGREIDASTLVNDLDDGTVLVLVDPAEAPPGADRRAHRRAGAVRVSAVWWAMAGGGGILALQRLLGEPGLPAAGRVAAGVVAVAASLAAGVVFALRTRSAAVGTLAPVMGAVALAFGGAVAAVPALPAGQALVAVFTGLLAAATVASVMGVLGAGATLRAQARTAALLLLVLAAVWGLALLLHLDVSAPAAVTVGLVPVAQRVLLSSLVDVAPGTFIDYGRFQTTRWTVRQNLPDEVRTIEAVDADALVERSTARLSVGVLLLVVAGSVSAFAAIPSFDPADPVVLGGRIALSVTVVLALLFGSRKSTVPFLRWVARAGAAAIVAAVLAALLPDSPPDLLVLIAGLCLAVGLGTGLLVVPVGRGLRSLGWSRTGDVLEAMSIALSLPAGLLAAGAVEVVRGMMAA